jgi:hypothetical protein
MPMSAWGMLAGPLLFAQAHDPEVANALAFLEPLALASAEIDGALGDALSGSDPFGGLAALDTSTMSASSGGESTAIDINNLGINISEQTGAVSGVNTTNSSNGAISGNVVTDNGGITTVFNNTGNGVIFQSTVNVNIFMAPSQ